MGGPAHLATWPTVSVVGRELELRAIRRFIGGDSGAGCLILCGEPGMGKTTLWEAGLDMARDLGCHVLSARTSEPEATLAFAALADIVDDIDEQDLRGLPAPQLHALEVALLRAEPVAAPPDPLAICTAFFGAIRIVGGRAPLLIAVDDIQWLDRASSDVLLFAARRYSSHRARFLLTRRPGRRSDFERVLERAGVDRVEVAGLSIGAVSRILSDRLGVGLSRRTLRKVRDGSQGNPLLAIELGRLLGGRTASEVGAELPVPEVAEDLFGARIREAVAPVRRALLAVALGGGLTRAELSRVVDPPAIGDAVVAGLVMVDGERVRPAHPMLAAAAHAHADVLEQRTLHRDLAAATDDPIRKARHLALATAVPDAEVAELAAAAADHAARHGRVWEAVLLAEHALRLTPWEEPERYERVLTLARFHAVAGDVRRVTELLSEGLDELPPGRPRAFARLLLSDSADLDDEAVEDQVSRALAEAGDDPEVKAWAFVRRAQHLALGSTERIDEAAAWAWRAAAAIAPFDTGVKDRVAGTLAWICALSGQPVDNLVATQTKSRGGAAIIESIDRALGVQLAFRGKIDEARTVFARLIADAEERGELRSVAAINVQQCEAELRAGHLHDANRLIDALDDVLLDAQVSLAGRGWFVGRLRAVAAAISGDPAEARRRATQFLEHNQHRSEPVSRGWNWLEAQRAAGLAALVERDIATAIAHLRAVWAHTSREHVDDPGAFPVAADLIEALVQLHQFDEARDVLQRLSELSRRQDHPWGLATTLRGESLVQLAQAADYLDAAADGLADAARAYSDLGLDFDAARTWLSLGVIQRRFKKRALARSSLEQSIAVFERCGSLGWANLAREEHARVSGRRSAKDDQLTPTERRVAGLAASGLSNKEIATQLFMSVNTVERHLSRAYAKLGVRSRAQLVNHLREPTSQ